MREPQVQRVGTMYVYRWPPPEAVEIEIDQVRQKSDDWHGYLTVRYRSPGVSPHLFEGNHNLSALQGRTALAKHLESRVHDVDWPAFLELACVMTIRAERQGEPFERVGSLALESQRPFWLIEPVVRVGLPTVLFGDGGHGKSTTALMLASTLLSGMEIAGFRPLWTAPVLYLDWETDREEIDDSLKGLRAGHGIDIPDIIYRREIWPLAQTYRQAQRVIAQEQVQLVVIDSLGAACGGEPESAEVALRFFGALRSLNCAAIVLHHENRKEGYYGSPYVRNSARLMFRLRKHQLPEQNVMHVGLYWEKANKGEMQHPRGLKVEYGEQFIRYEPEEIPADARELMAAMPQPEQIRRCLRSSRKAMTATEIADETGIPIASVKSRLSGMKGEVVRLDIRPVDGVRYAPKFALKSAYGEQEAG